MFGLEFNNAGDKIKTTAKILLVLGCLGSFAPFVYFIKKYPAVSGRHYILYGLLALLGVIIAVYVVCCFIAGFGELIATNQNTDCK